MNHKVTSLQAQMNNSQRINVYLDGKFAFGLSRITAAWLQVGQELNDEKITALQMEDGHEMAYQQAIKILSFRARSEKEVRQNLQKHAVPEFIVESIIERLRRGNLVNDKSFARTWVENRNEFRPRSCRLLAYELRQKGIPSEVIEQILMDIDEDELAYQAGIKQSHKWEQLGRREFNRKLSSFLARRGFPYDVIAPAIERIWTEYGSTE